MPQTETVSTKQGPKGLYLTAALFVTLACIGNLALEMNLIARQELVKWQPAATALEQAKAGHKPILYFFTAAWCGPCRKLRAESFADPKISNFINNNFVPVMVTDRHLEDGRNTPTVEKLEKFFSVEGFPRLAAAHWDYESADKYDLQSPDSGLKRRMNQSHWSLPYETGYKAKRQLLDYLQLAKLWYAMPATRGSVKWLPENGFKQGLPKRQKPALLVLLMQRERLSNNMRVYFLDNQQISDYINREFEPYLFEYSRLKDVDTPLGEQIRKKYAIKKLPALIVLNGRDTQPQVISGFSENDSTLDFLQRATNGKAVPPKLEDLEDSDFWEPGEE